MSRSVNYLDQVVEPAPSPTRLPDVAEPFHVVCLGASAGGLEALEKFFDNVPAESNLAFVVVQHLSPDFKSLMDELLARHTQMPIHRVTDGMALAAGSIYLIPPKKEMIVSAGKLLLTDKDPTQGLSLPIDTFMRSLAQDFGERAVGVILSGTGSDGSRGILAVHNAGGFVVAQDELSADFDGMPRSAIDTGIVDAVLPPHLMAGKILQHVDEKRLVRSFAPTPTISEAGMDELFSALRKAYGIDFTYYKPTTVARRVERRLQLSNTTDLNHYVTSVLTDGNELNALYKDLLIGVTKFFRDHEAYRRLEIDVIPQLLSRETEKTGLRIWVAGCATGEEAYSVAILLHEAITSSGQADRDVKIFATDVHRASLEFASAGGYSAESLSEVSAERMSKYFAKQGDNYQVLPELRKMIVFAPHNIVKDAPFTNIDLVTCRNLLIYLQPEAQTKALSLFHFGLRTGGFLFLGPSESTNELHEEFETIDRHWKIFRKRRDVRLGTTFRLPLSTGLEKYKTLALRPTSNKSLPEIHLLKAYDVLLDEHVPPSLLVDEHRKLLHSFAGAGHFLAIPDGRLRDDVLDYVAPDLKMPLAGALQRAAQRNSSVVYGGLRIPSLPETEQLRLTVKPVPIHSTGETYYLISFETEHRRVRPMASEPEVSFDDASRERLFEIEEELRYTKENLQATVEEMETTNEELQATNEELVASNEELQSTNEELHSVNEELYTVNGEHQRKITELTELTDDMDNLLRSTDIGTIFLDKDLNIRKFTPQISRAFQIVSQDVGRPLSAFTHNIQHESLLADAQEVLEVEVPFEKEVRDRHGNWLLLRILPYRSKERIEGVVITLIDIQGLKLSEYKLRRLSKVYMDCADPIILEDLYGRIVDINPQAEQTYGWKKEELVGQHITVLVPPEEAEAAIELRRRCREYESIRNIETWRCNRAGVRLPILLTLSLLTEETGEPIGIATIAKDISAQKAAEAAALQAVQRRDEFLAMLSHELRNPLGALSAAAGLLTNPSLPPDLATETVRVIHRQTRRMASLLDDLLDVSRITQGKISLRRQVVDLAALTTEAVESVRGGIEERQQNLQIDLGDEPLWVLGDPARLLQIQENLLTNASKYTPNKGQIRISLHRESDQAVFTVRDNGVGIDPELLGSIFDLFVQGENQLDRSNGGMGVGLSLVKMLVELHGGRVSLDSGGKDQGCEVCVSLPITSEPPEDDQQPQPLFDANACRVLIVEDNDDSRQMLAQLLRMEGYDVGVAADGLAGYQMIEQSAADIALIDIGLPKMNGYELARKVKAELTQRRIRLVALTGYGRESDRQAVLNAGFDAHLVKPVTPADLARVLRRPQE